MFKNLISQGKKAENLENRDIPSGYILHVFCSTKPGKIFSKKSRIA